MTASDVDLAVQALAAVQHGVFSRDQVLARDGDDGLIHRRVRSGRWQRVAPGTFLLPGTPSSWERAVIIAVLSCGLGAAASHGTAARLWELRVPRPRQIEVVISRSRRLRRDFVVHQSTDLEAGDVTAVDGIPTTTVERTLVDMGVPWGKTATARALDEAIRRELTTAREVARVLHRVARCGRNGVGVLRELLEERLGWTGLTDSVLEDELRRILAAAGLPLPVPQHRIVRRGGGFVGRTDFAYPEHRVLIELDGERYHTDRDAFRHDRRRQNAMVLEGWTVLRFTAWDLFATPEYVVAQVAAALRG